MIYFRNITRSSGSANLPAFSTMRSKPIHLFLSAALALSAPLFPPALPAQEELPAEEPAAPAAKTMPEAWNRYQPIIDRAPFGPIYDPVKAAEEGEGGMTVPGEVVDGPTLADTVKLSGITVYGGIPAAGFTDTTDNKSYYLYEGKSSGEFTLVKVLAEKKSIVLRKGEQQETITMGGPGAAADAPESAAPASGVRPSVPPSVSGRPGLPLRPAGTAASAASRTPGYTELNRKRAEGRLAAKEKADAERKAREEQEARKNEEMERLKEQVNALTEVVQNTAVVEESVPSVEEGVQGTLPE